MIGDKARGDVTRRHRSLGVGTLVLGLALLCCSGCASSSSAGLIGAAASAPASATGSPTPSPTPTAQPAIVGEVTRALTAVKALPGVTTATLDDQSGLTGGDDADEEDDGTLATPTPPTMQYRYAFTVVMAPDATAAESGAVPAAISESVANTNVSLELTLPATAGRVPATVDFDGTFDQNIPLATGTAIADGLSTIASTPGVLNEVKASIPYTMSVDAGSLTVFTTPEALDSVRSVIEGTVFAGTTLHGSFSNGAKP